MSRPRNPETIEAVRCRQIAAQVWNYLGILDPDQLARWLTMALKELKTTQAKQNDEGEEWKS